MPRKNIMLFLTVLLLCTNYCIYAQSHFEKNTEQYANEVFKNNPEYALPKFLKVYSEHLSRVEVLNIPQKNDESYKLLSSVNIINKYNSELTSDVGHFNTQTFNPLKYMFDYDSNVEQYYRVDHTNYVILIHHK